MKQQMKVLSVLSAAALLAACEGSDGLNGIDGTNGANGTDGADGFNSLVAVRDIPKGDAVCLGGGTAVDSGLDTNRNDVLDAGEVTASEILECAATPTLRALHASPDAPAVNIWVDGVPALLDVDYTIGSGFVPMAEENNIQVEAIIPGVATEDRIVIDADLAFDYSTETTVIATRNLADNAGVPNPLIITNPSDERITEGYFRAQVVHASPSAPEVDVFVTTPGAALAASAPFNLDNPLEFEEASLRGEAPAGDYQIRITAAGNPDAVVFDTGATPITLPAGADLMIVAVENQGPGETPVQLVVLDGTTASMLYDANTPASVVAVHLSPDAPAVDILADATATPEDDMVRLVNNVSFTEFCDINGVPAPGEYIINVALNDGGAIAYSTDALSFAKGDEALAIVSGFATPGLDPALQDITLAGNTRSVVTETKLRITHGSPSTPEVDLYLVARGAGTGGDPTFASVPFGADTTQLSIPVGEYDAYVTLAGSNDPAIAVEGILDFAGGEVLDIIARDPEGEEVGPQLTIVDYSTVDACPAPAAM